MKKTGRAAAAHHRGANTLEGDADAKLHAFFDGKRLRLERAEVACKSNEKIKKNEQRKMDGRTDG
jgi:hypothetical protein